MNNAPNRRRKVITGSLAAPVVLTVASPAALARSSFLACIQRGEDAARGAKPFIEISAPDGMYREKTAVWSLKDRNTGQAISGLFYSGPGGTYLSVDSCGPAGGYNKFAVDAVRAGDRLMLVYFDRDGHRVGAGCFPNRGYAVTKSCWSSFLKRK